MKVVEVREVGSIAYYVVRLGDVDLLHAEPELGRRNPMTSRLEEEGMAPR